VTVSHFSVTSRPVLSEQRLTSAPLQRICAHSSDRWMQPEILPQCLTFHVKCPVDECSGRTKSLAKPCLLSDCIGNVLQTLKCLCRWMSKLCRLLQLFFFPVQSIIYNVYIKYHLQLRQLFQFELQFCRWLNRMPSVHIFLPHGS